MAQQQRKKTLYASFCFSSLSKIFQATYHRFEKESNLMYRITAESVNKASRERLRKIESGEVKPNKISTDLEGKKLREAYIRFRDASDQEIEIC